MKLIVLSDNRSIDNSLESEHGLSMYLETEKYKYLLDTGASELFIRNAKKLNVDLTKVNYVFISHGHADHLGGLEAFLKLNSTAKIILSKNAITGKYFSKRLGWRSISVKIDPKEYKNEFIFIEKETQLNEEFKIYIAKELNHSTPYGNGTLYKEINERMELDDFNHEIIACIGTNKLFVFVGCGHKGLLNILETIKKRFNQKIGYVVGGFHLLDSTETRVYESEQEIEILGEILKKKFPQTDFFTGHCTGENAFKLLKKKLEFRLIHFFTGYYYTDSFEK